MNKNKELNSAGYTVSLLWLLLQTFQLSNSILIFTGILSVKYDANTTTLLTAFFTTLGYFGLAAISGVISYNGPCVQKKYWAALCIAQITSIPFSLWDSNNFLLWSLIVASVSLILTSYAFLGFMKLRNTLETEECTSTTNNLRNILIGFFVVVLLVSWNIWYENVWNNAH